MSIPDLADESKSKCIHARIANMRLKKKVQLNLLFLFLIAACPVRLMAWHDETHIAIAKVAGYSKWYNAAGADMVKIKAHDIESFNHYVNNPTGRLVTPEIVLEQAQKYNQVDEDGHLYGAIIASIRDYIRDKEKGKYGEYHLAFCTHYVGDLSQPLHNMPMDSYNRKYHVTIDGIVNDEVLDNLDKIQIYGINLYSEEDLAMEISRIANISLALARKISEENRSLTKEEAYVQLGHSASLLKAILGYLDKYDP